MFPKASIVESPRVRWAMTDYRNVYGPHDYGTRAEQDETISRIADHLAKEQGKTQREVWQEAEDIFRTQFNNEILPPPDD